MMQELLGGGARLLGGERKIPFNGGILEGSPSSSSPSPSSSSTTTTTNTTSATTTPSDQQNLRCPRCDSPNTKFCYYNNYNLTQPRHFCKTCRRYWTKGGALRNVPIGGGCRKNKTTTVVTSTVGNTGKSKSASDMVKSNLGNHGFDHETSSPNPNPILWAAPQNSHLLALLRSTQNPNPNPNPLINHVTIKEEGNMTGSHARTLSGDPLMNQVSPIGLCSSFWRNNQNQIQHHHHHQQQQQQQHGFLMGEVQNSGIQELYQRLRSSVNYYTDNTPAGLSSVASTSSSILESAPVTGGESGYWNPSFPWSDLPTTNGAYP